LIGRSPEYFAEIARVPRHEQDGKVEEPMKSHGSRESQEEARSQAPKRDGNKGAVQQAGHQPFSHVAAKQVEGQRCESRHACDEMCDQPHLADRESESDGDRVTDEVCRGDVATDGGNEQRNQLGWLFGKRRVKRRHPLIGYRRGAQLTYKPVVQRNANEIERERLQRQRQRRCQPHQPLIGRHFQPVNQRDKDRSSNAARKNRREVNAGHPHGSIAAWD
jgi:hypothetical protein